MNYLVTAFAYLVSLALVASLASLMVIYLVGPHGGVLSQAFYLPVLGLGWLTVIVLPVQFARWMWRRMQILK
jgi:hypothetical protein